MDARECAYNPRIHLFREKSLEVGRIAPQFGLARVAQYNTPQVGVNPTCAVKPGNDISPLLDMNGP